MMINNRILLLLLFLIILFYFQFIFSGKNLNINNKVDNIINFNVLDSCKLTFPDSKIKVADYGKVKNFNSDFFYIKDSNIVFVLKKGENDGKMRNELRQGINGKNLGWNILDKKIHYLLASIKLTKIKDLDEYTFLQIHSEVNPLLRVIVKKNKNGIQNHIWAIVRINTNKIGKRTERYDLGEVNNKFEKIEILAGDKKLIVKKDNRIFVDKDVSYWPEKQNYFKAGIYDSKNSKGPWEVHILFNKLNMN